MIPYGRQNISDDDIAAVVDVMRSEWLTQGPGIASFEQAVAAVCQAQHAVAVSNATAALHIACLALDVGPGDLVWTSPISFVASANAALYCGAEVDFIDIDPRTYCMAPERLAEKLAAAKAAGRLPKAVIPVHMCGQSADMAAIGDLCAAHGVRVVEDASHCVGARYRNRPVGSCAHSDIAVFSFHPVKMITTGEGGMAMTNDPTLAEAMRRARSHGIVRAAEDLQRENDGPWYHEMASLGFNYRMTDIAAALGLSQLARLDEFIARRREIAARYDAAFAGSEIVAPWQHPDAMSSYHLYAIRLGLGTAPHRTVFERLRAAGIGVQLHYIPIYRQPYYQALGFKDGYCPEAEAYYRSAISLPIYPDLSDADQDRVIASLFEAIRP